MKFLIAKKINFEVIIVNNGSTDKSKIVIDENKYKLNNLNIININNNIGFGNGIKKGILASKNKIICYTHMETFKLKLKIALSLSEIYQNSIGGGNRKLFVKSKRKGRGLVSSFFTLFMSIFNSIIFNCFVNDIHSQPNLFENLH